MSAPTRFRGEWGCSTNGMASLALPIWRGNKTWSKVWNVRVREIRINKCMNYDGWIVLCLLWLTPQLTFLWSPWQQGEPPAHQRKSAPFAEQVEPKEPNKWLFERILLQNKPVSGEVWEKHHRKLAAEGFAFPKVLQCTQLRLLTRCLGPWWLQTNMACTRWSSWDMPEANKQTRTFNTWLQSRYESKDLDWIKI